MYTPRFPLLIQVYILIIKVALSYNKSVTLNTIDKQLAWEENNRLLAKLT